ncbi:hypothetical protein LG311_19080 [Sutcliffiella horikoshii]|uniref:hypothetical protein n=1 Tax=Sutcliffiella horikoshii TaxID=79883 RepID=UPI00384E1AA0
MGDAYAPSLSGLKKITGILDRVDSRLDIEPVTNYLRAGVQFAFQNLEEAQALISKSPYPSEILYSDFFKGGNTYKNPNTTLCLQNNDFKLSNFFKVYFDDLPFKLRNENIPLLIFSCDMKYFEFFAENLVDSIMKSGFYSDLLFFIIEDENSQNDVIVSKIRYKLKNIGRELYIIKASLIKNEMPALAASGRYLIAKDVINRTGQGVFIFDIDFEFKAEMLNDLKKAVATNSIALTINKYGRNIYPWATIPAATAFIPNNEAGKVLLDIFSLYIQNNFREEGGNWWIDQNALFAGYNYIRKYYPQTQILDLVGVRNAGATNGEDDVKQFKRQTESR